MLDDRKLPKTRSLPRVDAIAEACAGKRVLNIGMGGWIDDAGKSDRLLTRQSLESSVHYRLSKVCDRLVGTDILEDSCQKMKALVPGDYVQADIMGDDFADRFGEKFDMVVFAEVLEHLDDFRSALANIAKVLEPGGEVLITTVNAYSVERFAKMLLNYEANHEEHTAYFSYLCIRRLLQMNGWEMTRFDFHNEVPGPANKRSRHVTYQLVHALTRAFPQLSEGIFLTARPIAAV